MKGKKLLFVTYHDENFEEGFSYALDLARTMNDGIELLMLYKRSVLKKLDDVMTAITFAEEGEHKTAREMISEDNVGRSEDFEKKTAALRDACRNAGMDFGLSFSDADAVSAVKNVLGQNPRIEMVLLSPSITNDGNINTRTLNKLVKTASRPVVTMSKQAHVA